MDNELSYHDVTVYVGNVMYKPSENYALQLLCTKAGGWNLYHAWGGKEHLIGGEYDAEPFCIEVAGMIICGKKPKHIEQPKSIGGWSGLVQVA
jgi:hypothetical protein